MWADTPGGWTYEFSQFAAEYQRRGDNYLASVAYGVAKFPVLANPARRRAFRNQIEQYQLASSQFGLRFERRTLALPYRDRTTRCPIHVLTPVENYQALPVLIFSGGIDTWKMDLHPLAASLAIAANITVAAFDIPGTGESDEPLDEFADEVFLALINEARQIGNGKVAHFGLSFGGNFSAMSGLTGQVDAAVNLGGPIDAAFTPGNFRNLMFGMAGIAGNAFGFETLPAQPEMVAAAQPFARQQMLERRENSPMLVINGADDVHVPQSDTTVFEGRPDTEVHLLPGSGHCATSRLAEVLGIITNWLAQTLTQR
jgi:esterase FrsA